MALFENVFSRWLILSPPYTGLLKCPGIDFGVIYKLQRVDKLANVKSSNNEY